jgi:hypothetical protein
MFTRRNFIQQTAAAGIFSSIPGKMFSGNSVSKPKIWACLLHLSYNMWVEYSTPGPFKGYRPYLQLDEELLSDFIRK